MRIGALVAFCVVLAGLQRAEADHVQLTITLPPEGLDFGRTPFENESAPRRIRIHNSGDPAGGDYSYIGSGPFVIVATGGDLDTGHDKFYDVVCKPYAAGPFNNTGVFNVDVCAATGCGDDEWVDWIWMSCEPGLLDTPEASVTLPFVYAYEVSQQTIAFTNPGPSPITITGLASHAATFSAVLATGTFPLTLAPGDSVDVLASFDTSTPNTGTDYLFTDIDVLAGTAIAGRVQVLAQTISQLDPQVWQLSGVPQGAVYRVPITVRNSFPSARTITAATANLADFTVTGLVGTTLGPREVALGFVTFSATTLGARETLISFAFNTGQGNTARFLANVLPPTFSVTTSDPVPGDGLLELETRRVGSPVEQTITFHNLDAVEWTVVACSGAGAPFELVDACPATIPANSSVELAIRFSPTAVGDPRSGFFLAIAEKGYIGAAMIGHAVAHQLAFSTTSLGFPTTPRGEAARLAVTITNLLPHSITMPLAITGAGFTTDQTAIEIPGGATADVTVQFQPPASGSFTGALEIGVAGDPDHAIVSLTGTGDEPEAEGEDEDDDEESPAGPRPHGGGCDAGGAGACGGAIALLAVLRRRRRA